MSLLLGVPGLVLVPPFLLWVGAGYALSVAPEWYQSDFARWLGITCGGFDFALSPADEARIIAAGLNPDAAANAAAARSWCKSIFGSTIDLGIQMAIFQYESGNGTNMGSCDWQEAIERRWGNSNQAAKEKAAAQWLLNHWEKYGVRENNPTARAFIYPGYGGYIGHCSAAEIGMGGFIPTTAKSVCQKGLAKSGDDDVKSCDFWSVKVTFHAIAYWLHAIGYRAELSRNEKIAALFGWNHDSSYRNLLVSRAEEINTIVGDVSIVGSGGSSASLENLLTSPIGVIKYAVRWFLEQVGLLPEAPGWLAMPLYPEDLLGISQLFDPQSGHYGKDFACKLGAPVLAVADGVIVEPSPGTYMDREPAFGNQVWIGHGGLFTQSAHMKDVYVHGGEVVKQGQVIGTCGSTGNSTGPHVHFAVADKHPDEFVNWRDMNPGFLDPDLYLGTCGVQTVEA